MRFKNFVVLAALLFVVSLSASAGIIGNGPPNQTGGSDLNSFLEADNFTLDNNNSINQVQFWALQSAPSDYTGSIEWAIYTDAAGMPGTSVANGTAAAIGTPTGNTTFGLDEYSYIFGASAALSANTTYWLVLHNGPSTTDPSIAGSQFYWAWSADSGDSQSQDILGGPWAGNSSELAFQVNAVPEPASLCLIGSGLLTGWLKRRKNIAKN